MNTTNKNFFPTMEAIREEYSRAEKSFFEQEEEVWNSLSDKDKLNVFCAVVRRICKAELEDNGTYRHALYTVFGFDIDSYGRGMACGYLDLHNSIVLLDKSDG